jgi:hypothetical protein
MQMLTSLWTTVRAQLRDSREARAQAAIERGPSRYRTPEVLIDPSNVLGHRI